MLFQLPMFFVFFLAFVVLLRLCPASLLFPYVTAASLFFYAVWYPPYVVLLAALVVMTWLLLQLVARDRRYLTAAVLIALLPLAFFKYTDFVLQTIGSIVGSTMPTLGWVLPLGISFVTFTVVSFLVDTARAESPVAPKFWQTAVYITFFPHLIAGPILRANQTLPLLPGIRFTWAALVPNLALFAVGMTKKVLVADPIGNFVDQAYAAHATIDAWHALVAVFGFSIQIYCDFSAYSDMAIALAGMLGVAFPENFRSPYAAASLSDVWRGWHITLSLWMRDYVYKPLLKIVSRRAAQLSLVLTMTVSGLWHGASWTFVLWGLVQGLIMVVESASGFKRWAAGRRGIPYAACVVYTFTIWSLLVVLFRSPDLATAYDIVFGWWQRGEPAFWPADATVPVILGVCTLALHPLDQINKIRAAARRVPAALLTPILIVIIAGCSVIAAARPQAFYYFDF
jgi:alginate O-acetyltransferase complex protein AlgI